MVKLSTLIDVAFYLCVAFLVLSVGILIYSIIYYVIQEMKEERNDN